MDEPARLLVIDVEGTDGRERGEDQGMERRSALFSLAVSSVLIINLFENDVGRYNGANYGLLKTVFEVNLNLFQDRRHAACASQWRHGPGNAWGVTAAMPCVGLCVRRRRPARPRRCCCSPSATTR